MLSDGHDDCLKTRFALEVIVGQVTVPEVEGEGGDVERSEDALLRQPSVTPTRTCFCTLSERHRAAGEAAGIAEDLVAEVKVVEEVPSVS
jgi:hypothetical protein